MNRKVISVFGAGILGIASLITFSLWFEDEPEPVPPPPLSKVEDRLNTRWDLYRYQGHYQWVPSGEQPMPANPAPRLVKSGLLLKDIKGMSKRQVDALANR